MSARILVVEDDPELGPELVRQLRRAGLEPALLADGDAAMREPLDGYALVLLDLVLPGAYGLDVLKRIRRESEVPVMVLTARDHTADKVRGLSLGADDYVTKPFWPEELVARIRARLRRPAMERAEEGVVRIGTLEIDAAAHAVRVAGAPVEVTRAELVILTTLARRPGHAVSRAALAEAALDGESAGAERALDVHVSRLRKKLGAEGKRIVTVWGVGYRLEPEAAT